jgi:uncharacterized protein (TIGR03437 family)
VGVSASDVDESPLITASVAGAVRTTSLAIVGIRPVALRFSESAIQAGTWSDAEIELNSTNVPAVARLNVASSTADLLVPPSIVTRPGQTRARFRVYLDARAKQQAGAEIQVRFGETTVRTPIAVMPAGAPVLSLPDELAVRIGGELSLTVSAIDPNGLPLVYAASGLPAGAQFDATTGRFAWTPVNGQEGAYEVGFKATNTAQASGARSIRIMVDTGRPVAVTLRSAARRTGPTCSPGSLASVEGRWLAPSTAQADPSGELAGTRVKVNGEYAALTAVSPSRVDFLCPVLPAGTTLAVSVENGAGKSDAVTGVTALAAPALFSIDGTGAGEGLVYLSGTSLMATSRDYRALGQPAQPGDSITIRATGVDPQSLPPLVSVGGMAAKVEAVSALPGMAGVFEITVTVPLGVQPGSAVPIQASFGPLPAEDSSRRHVPVRVRSNLVTVAIEEGRR